MSMSGRHCRCSGDGVGGGIGDLIEIVEDDGEVGDLKISSNSVAGSLLSKYSGFDVGVDEEKASA